MIITTGNIKINAVDDILFESPIIDVEADAQLRRGIWEVIIRAIVNSSLTGRVTKTYTVSGSSFSQYDTGEGEFASNLAGIIEQFVILDLASFNPEAKFEIVK